MGFLSWERWLLWGDVGKSLVEEGRPGAAWAHNYVLGGAASVFLLSKDREGRGMETLMPLSDPGIEAPGRIMGC